MDSSSPTDNSANLLILAQASTAPRPSAAKDMAYSPGDGPDAVSSDYAYRSERGQPFLRAGSLVVATPQFKGLTLYSPTGQTQQINVPIPTNSAVGATSSPTTTSGAYAVIPEMKVSITTSGGKILILFSSVISTDTNATGSNYAIFRDGVQVATFANAWPTANIGQMIAFSFLDNPPLGVHTYDIRWNNTGGANKLTASGTQRTIQASEIQTGSSPSTSITIP